MTSFIGGFGAGAGVDIGTDRGADLGDPTLALFTNDAWPVVRGIADNNGFPILLMNQYGKGTAVRADHPRQFHGFYLLPAATLNAIRSYVLGNFPVRVEAPAKVSLFAYDNGTFIVESFRDEQQR